MAAAASTTAARSSSRWVQHGVARLRAAATGTGIATSPATSSSSSSASSNSNSNCNSKTRLTLVSHKAPLRWVPICSSSTKKAGAAICALSSYGGGMLSGDVHKIQIEVNGDGEENSACVDGKGESESAPAKLGVITQGPTRIYKRGGNQNSRSRSGDESNNNYYSSMCTSHLEAIVGANGFLVMAMDPCIPFKGSSFSQSVDITLKYNKCKSSPSSSDDRNTGSTTAAPSVIFVDWFGAGRLSKGEHWDFDELSTRTALYVDMQEENDDDNATDASAVTGQQQQRRIPRLVESTCMMRNKDGGDRQWWGLGDGESADNSANHGNSSWNAYASVILHGPQAEPVVRRLHQLSVQLTSRHTRVRQPPQAIQSDHDNKEESTFPLLSLSSLRGKVILGVNKIEASTSPPPLSSSFGPTFVARMATTGDNEDLYRILHSCFQPLSSQFGFEFYKDRIHSSKSAATTVAALSNVSHSASPTRRLKRTNTPSRILKPTTTATRATCRDVYSSMNSWTSYMLADSGLPTGSFAHSAGLEAAAQLGLLSSSSSSKNPQALQHFVHSALASGLQLHLPFVLETIRQRQQKQGTLHNNDFADQKFIDEWSQLDSELHAYMVSNAVSCRASLEQGRGLLRVGLSWLRERQQLQQQQQQEEQQNDIDEELNVLAAQRSEDDIAVLQKIQDLIVNGKQHGHLASIFGVMCESLDLSAENDQGGNDNGDQACRLLGYCAARDMISAAVRLNLIGPMAGVSLLDSCWDVVETKIASAKVAGSNNDDHEERLSSSVCFSQDGDHNDALSMMAIPASTCAPIVETVHPCHELLSTRLFRT